MASMHGARTADDGRAVVVDVIPGEIEFGTWCDEHALPCGFTVGMFTMCEHGVQQIGTYGGCVTDPRWGLTADDFEAGD